MEGAANQSEPEHEPQSPDRRRSDDIRRLALRYHLGSLLVSNEFMLYFGDSKPFQLTTQLLPSLDDSLPPVPLVNPPQTKIPGAPFSLPALSRTVYARWVRAIPWLTGNGMEFLKIFDAHIDSAGKGFVVSWLRATQFDLLGFAKHYYALFLFAYEDPNLDSSQLSCNPPEDGCPPATVQEFKDAILSRLARTPSHSGRFTTHPTSTEDAHAREAPLEAPIDARNEIQELRYKNLSSAFMKFLRQGALILTNLQPLPGTQLAYGPKLFSLIAQAKTTPELPQVLQLWIKYLARALAVGFENVLDDPMWRGKAQRVWAKMPLSLIVTSLRIVNPVPFVETLLRIFVWKPPGGLHSLLQSLAGVLCSMSTTRNRVKQMKAALDATTRVKIEATIATLWGTSGEISSTPQDEPRVLSALNAAGIPVNETYRDSPPDAPEASIKNQNTRYARILIRQFEKNLFIDSLGDDKVTNLIVHFIKFLPPVLKELWECVQMADLLQCFFDQLTEMLDVVGRYDREEEVDLGLPGKPDSIAPPPVQLDKAKADAPRPSFSSYASSFASSVYNRAASSTPTLSPTSSPIAKPKNDTDSIHSIDKTADSKKREVSKDLYLKTVDKLESCILTFIDKFYPAMHKLSSRESSGMIGMHEIVDWIVREFGEGLREFDAWPAENVKPSSAVLLPNVGKRCVLDISAYDAAEAVVVGCEAVGLVDNLWVEVDRVSMGLLVSGVDENGWVRNSNHSTGVSSEHEENSGEKFELEKGILGSYGVAVFREQILTMDGAVLPDDPIKFDQFKHMMPKKTGSTSSLMNLLGVSRSASSSCFVDGEKPAAKNSMFSKSPSVSSLRGSVSSVTSEADENKGKKKTGWF
ncbi:hypothetical protein HDU80_008999 [Chytriomyces hyalinus]|nr:hypothetical protein HDU80_008999 [Chytriomyces hyalinus]